MSDCDACDAAIADLHKKLEAERVRVSAAEEKLAAFRGALEAATLGWFEQLTTARRFITELQIANTALLLRAREAEAAQLEAEAEIEARDERDADLALEMKDTRD